jgi:hypothetical protein
MFKLLALYRSVTILAGWLKRFLKPLEITTVFGDTARMKSIVEEVLLPW